jgi:hypothetical protein
MPKDHRFEIRCCMWDLDSNIIEIGQSKNDLWCTPLLKGGKLWLSQLSE